MIPKLNDIESVWDDEKGVLWQEIPNDRRFVHLGFCKTPETNWQTFWYHFHHGMLMRYGFWKVLYFSLANMNSFNEFYTIEFNEGDLCIIHTGNVSQSSGGMAVRQVQLAEQ